MTRKLWQFFVAVAGSGLILPAQAAEDTIKVDGTNATFPTTVQVDGVTLRATGTAIRTRLVFQVYAMASYVESTAVIANADELCKAEKVKQLRLHILRPLSAETALQGIRDGVALNHPGDAFAAPFAAMKEYLGGAEVATGDTLTITYLPGTGARIALNDRAPLAVADPAFGQALWQIYFGPKNLAEPMKTALVSRLGQ